MAVLRERIRKEEGHLQESTDPQLVFGSPESPGFKLNWYICIVVSTFGNPFACLTIQAAKAHDSRALFAILAVLFSTFIFSRQLLIRDRNDG
jgi:hypothetical protein